MKNYLIIIIIINLKLILHNLKYHTYYKMVANAVTNNNTIVPEPYWQWMGACLILHLTVLIIAAHTISLLCTMQYK